MDPFYMVDNLPIFLTNFRYSWLLDECEENGLITEDDRAKCEFEWEKDAQEKVRRALISRLEILKHNNDDGFITHMYNLSMHDETAIGNFSNFLYAYTILHKNFYVENKPLNIQEQLFSDEGLERQDWRWPYGKKFTFVYKGKLSLAERIMRKQCLRIEAPIDIDKLEAVYGNLGGYFSVNFKGGAILRVDENFMQFSAGEDLESIINFHRRRLSGDK